MGLPYDEIVDILDVKYIAGSTTGHTLEPATYEITNVNLMLKSLLPNKAKVNITIDDIGLRSNLTTNKTIRYTRNSIFYKILGIAQSHSGVLGDIEGLVQLIPGSFKSEKPIEITGIDNILSKFDCNN